MSLFLIKTFDACSLDASCHVSSVTYARFKMSFFYITDSIISSVLNYVVTSQSKADDNAELSSFSFDLNCKKSI
jgi:hypothetical protein